MNQPDRMLEIRIHDKALLLQHQTNLDFLIVLKYHECNLAHRLPNLLAFQQIVGIKT
jgi:hypothetical protein